MSELQDAIDYFDGTGEPVTHDYGPEMVLVLEAARKYANPDYEFAADALCRFDNATGPDVAVEGIPCDIHRNAARLAVDAALGITEDTE